VARDLIGVGSDAKERKAKSCVTLERMMVDSSAGSVIRTRFRAWSAVAGVVIVVVVVVVVVVGGCCCWQLLAVVGSCWQLRRPFPLIENGEQSTKQQTTLVDNNLDPYFYRAANRKPQRGRFRFHFVSACDCEPSLYGLALLGDSNNTVQISWLQPR
jgi:hypothetical protein